MTDVALLLTPLDSPNLPEPPPLNAAHEADLRRASERMRVAEREGNVLVRLVTGRGK